MLLKGLYQSDTQQKTLNVFYVDLIHHITSKSAVVADTELVDMTLPLVRSFVRLQSENRPTSAASYIRIHGTKTANFKNSRKTKVK
jgi:hypothetical protein